MAHQPFDCSAIASSLEARPISQGSWSSHTQLSYETTLIHKSTVLLAKAHRAFILRTRRAQPNVASRLLDQLGSIGQGSISSSASSSSISLDRESRINFATCFHAWTATKIHRHALNTAGESGDRSKDWHKKEMRRHFGENHPVRTSRKAD